MIQRKRQSPSSTARARALRQPLTPAEAQLWQRLRNGQLGARVRRQHPIGRFVSDFCCLPAKLVIEIDGDSHAPVESRIRDAARTASLEALGFRVIRFTNEDVAKRLDAVLETLWREIQIQVPQDDDPGFSPHPGPLPAGERE